jgi:hypothetical protein
MVVVVVDGDGGGRGGGDDENNGNGRNGEGSGRNGANWEVGQIMGMDSEGMMELEQKRLLKVFDISVTTRLVVVCLMSEIGRIDRYKYLK